MVGWQSIKKQWSGFAGLQPLRMRRQIKILDFQYVPFLPSRLFWWHGNMWLYEPRHRATFIRIFCLAGPAHTENPRSWFASSFWEAANPDHCFSIDCQPTIDNPLAPTSLSQLIFLQIREVNMMVNPCYSSLWSWHWPQPVEPTWSDVAITPLVVGVIGFCCRTWIDKSATICLWPGVMNQWTSRDSATVSLKSILWLAKGLNPWDYCQKSTIKWPGIIPETSFTGFVVV